MKINSGQAPSTLVPKYIGSDFDQVVTVGKNIEDVKAVACAVEDVGVVADNLGSVTNVATNIGDVVNVSDNMGYVQDVAAGIAGLPVISYIGEEPPTQPEVGSSWFCTTDGRTYVWYKDVDSYQWVESSPQSAPLDLQDVREVAIANTERQMKLLGYDLVKGSFEEGALLSKSTDVVLYKHTGVVYKWKGVFPAQIAANSSPAGTGISNWEEVVVPVMEASVMEALRRSYAEAGYNVVGTFRKGFTIVNANDVGIDERTGKAFSGTAGSVAAGTDPASGGFVDVSGVLGKDRLRPKSISEAIQNIYSIGEVIITASYYSKTEIAGFGLSSPQGGGARYIVVSGAGITADNVKYHSLPNGYMLELLDTPNSRNAGMVGNYVDSSNKGFDNLQRAIALDAINRQIGAMNRFHGGKFYLAQPALELGCDTRGDGNYATEFYVEPPAGAVEVACGKLLQRNTMRDVAFYPASTDATKSFMANKFSDLFVPSFAYNSKLYGPNIDSECAVIDCAGRGFSRGLQGVSGSKNVTIVRGDYWGGKWGVSFYNVSLLSFDGTKVYGGDVGGMGMPSCKHVTVGGGAIVYNPDGTGVNTGGSSAVGYNADDINVGRCTVYARDCINLENGCTSANISGYKLYVVTSLPQNGVGVGVFSRASDNGGVVGNINVGPGFIEGAATGPGQYSHAVKIGFNGASPNAAPLSTVTVVGVNAVGCRVGCETLAPSNSYLVGFKAGQNTFSANQRGYAMYGEHQDGSISGGEVVYSGDTTVSGTRGVDFSIVRRFVFDGLKIQGFAEHYRQNGIAQESWINNPVGIKGRDFVNFTELNNVSGSGPIPIKRTT